MGRAINKTVAIVELLKVNQELHSATLIRLAVMLSLLIVRAIPEQRRVVGLHQNNSIESIDITDTWEPLEEGLNMYALDIL
jgi:ribonuclease P/MRP protein subunit RPP25